MNKVHSFRESYLVLSNCFFCDTQVAQNIFKKQKTCPPPPTWFTELISALKRTQPEGKFRVKWSCWVVLAWLFKITTCRLCLTCGEVGSLPWARWRKQHVVSWGLFKMASLPVTHFLHIYRQSVFAWLHIIGRWQLLKRGHAECYKPRVIYLKNVWLAKKCLYLTGINNKIEAIDLFSIIKEYDTFLTWV